MALPNFFAAPRSACVNGRWPRLAPGRLVPWLAIAFGSGIVVYFTAEREPALWAASLLVVATVVLAVLARHRPVAFPVMLGIAAAAAASRLRRLNAR